MTKTRAELEAENTALRGLLAAVGEGQPPLPASDAEMTAWYRECASRLSSITIRAASAARYDDDASRLVVTILRDKTADLREQWQRPLYYTPEGEPPPKGGHPYPGVMTCEAVSEVGTTCNGLDSHPLPHKDANGFEWGDDAEADIDPDQPVNLWPAFYGPALNPDGAA